MDSEHSTPTDRLIADKIKLISGAPANHRPELLMPGIDTVENRKTSAVSVDFGATEKGADKIIDEVLIPLRKKMGLTSAEMGFAVDNIDNDSKHFKEGQIIIFIVDPKKEGPILDKLSAEFNDKTREDIGKILSQSGNRKFGPLDQAAVGAFDNLAPEMLAQMKASSAGSLSEVVANAPIVKGSREVC